MGNRSLNDLDVQEYRVRCLISTCGDYDEGGRGTGFSSSTSISGMFIFMLTHCGRVTQICVFNTVKLGTSANSP